VKQARYAEAAGRLLRRLHRDASPGLPRDRQRLVASVEHALHARARRTAVMRVAVGFGAAAAVALVAGVAAWRHAPPASAAGSAGAPLTVLAAEVGAVTSNGPLRRGMIVTPGLRLVAPAIAEVQVGTASGTALTLEKGSEVTVSEASATQRFALRSGGIRAHVAHLLAGQRFIVDTGDAEVEVHGTTFRVAVVGSDPACGAGTHTRVSVSEGIVTVRSASGEARVPAGTEWPTGCELAAAEPRRAMRPARHIEPRMAPSGAVETDVPASAALASSGALRTPAAPETVTPALRPTERPSQLGAQNDLFAAAVRARQEGRTDDAIATYTRLIEGYPQGPLVESAMAQRMKVLAGVDPMKAASAAAAYLARFPAGFARADAERIGTRASP
jgi:FecR protein